VSRDEQCLVHGEAIADDPDALYAIEQAEHSGDARALILCLSHLCQRLQWRGEFQRAIEFGERAMQLGEREKLTGETLFGTWFVGISYGAQGEYGRALELLGGGLALCDRIGDRAVAPRMLNTLGWLHAEFGCHRQAIEYNQLATDRSQELVELGLVAGAPELYANAAINLAGNLNTLGETGGAAEQLARIQAQLDASDDPWMEWRYAIHLFDAQARLHLTRGELDRGLERAEQALRGAASASSAKLEARALETRGRLLLAMDRRDEAEPGLHQALELARSIGHPPVLWRAASLLAEVARRRGRAEETERWQAETLRCVEHIEQGLPGSELRSGLRDLGHLLITDPLASHR
jgi:tetratricopeptide (TPR) repeat protein